ASDGGGLTTRINLVARRSLRERHKREPQRAQRTTRFILVELPPPETTTAARWAEFWRMPLPVRPRPSRRPVLGRRHVRPADPPRRAVEDVAHDQLAVALRLRGLLVEAPRGVGVALLAFAGGQLPGQHHLLLEGAHRRPQRRLQGLSLLGQQRLAVV